MKCDAAGPNRYNCSEITYEQPPQPAGLHDLCVKHRSTAIVEAAIDRAAALGYRSQPILMGWSSGGAMASAFVGHAHARSRPRSRGPGVDSSTLARAPVTERGTGFTIRGLVLLSSGGQYCYAYDYDKLPVVVKNKHWSNCTSQKQPYGTKYGCCPTGLTERYFYLHPEEYHSHPPTLLVQSQADCNSDTDAALYYHQAMTDHGLKNSVHFDAAGQCHDVSPPVLGVIVSWLKSLLVAGTTRAASL
jgi:predicted esterase